MTPESSRRDADVAAGSISACLLDGKGGARELDAEAARTWRPEQGVLWVTGPASAVVSWVGSAPDADPADVGIFTYQPAEPWAELVRPDVLVIVFVQPAQGMPDPAPPGWTGAFHAWARPRLLVTEGEAPVIREVRGKLAQGRGPRDVADLLVSMSERAEDRTRAALLAQDGRVAAAEEAFAEERPGAFDEVASLRRSLLALRRRSAALSVIRDRLRSAEVTWLASARGRWRVLEREALDDVVRLDALLDRIQALYDRHAHRAADRTNRALSVVTIYTAIFAPLTFVAAMLGMNVGIGESSVPGLSRPFWFFVVAATLVLLVVVEFRFIRRLRPP